MSGDRLLDDIDAAREAVRALCHQHWPCEEVRERIELAGAHLLAAWRTAKFGGDESDDIETTHRAVRAGYKLTRVLQADKKATAAQGGHAV